LMRMVVEEVMEGMASMGRMEVLGIRGEMRIGIGTRRYVFLGGVFMLFYFLSVVGDIVVMVWGVGRFGIVADF